MKKYKLENKPFGHMYHFDCYRIQSSAEILDLNWQEIISDAQNIILAEWAEKISDILPSDTLLIYFKNLNKEQRAIRIGAPSS
jgi:tRNA threonylcarbamoyladenosine biosynthesis protein TsaE